MRLISCGFFDDLPDPRSEVNRLHRLGDVIVIAICAVIAAPDGPTAIANGAKLNERWLRKHLALPNGIPGKDTFRRVLELLNPAAFQQCFQQWLESLNALVDGEPRDKTHIA
ncbi:MAG: transposase family protein, partial [Planctomycetes bacterium]|nr:transposase family protein [Planctomycetota bacterium]